MLTLEQWNRTLPKPRNLDTIRRWARNGQIWPPPIFDGHQYFVQENAIKLLPKQQYKPVNNLITRIQNGT
ncbi:excisionase [Yersinia enterocolitica]|uniref:excisionase n=1 Tax=Yersinia kristensenii TaxID=28152 RepID=UPI0005191286|nr:excisionase [Yersinia enterocolitica]PEH52796.1 excisionase [Yersinia kristensenii]SUP70654.1 excisionase [Yersinia kristensenii]SUQ39279.1 excisionase [Yersinia kristensenii]